MAKKQAKGKGKDEDETIFPEGLIVFSPHKKAPDFVKATIILTPRKLVEWLKENEDLLEESKYGKQLRMTLKESKGGLLYLQVDTYKRDAQNSEPEAATTNAQDDLPF